MKKILNIILLLLSIFIVGCTKTPPISEGNQEENNNQQEGNNNQQEEYIPPYKNNLKVYFINVGQADCSLIILPNGRTVLIDAGLDHATTFDENNFPSWENIKKIFELENIYEIDYLIITHNHSDHYYYVSDIINNYYVKTVYMSGSTTTSYTYLDILNTIKNKKVTTKIVTVGFKMLEEKDLTMQVVATQQIDNPDDANSCSVMVKLTYGKRSFLFTGDAGYREGDAEPIALNSGIDLKSDVLKVGHHGSTYSSGHEFLSKVRPQFAVITSAKVTSTGHPHKAALNRLNTYCDYILQSKDDGTILFESNGNTLTYKTHIGE